MLAPKVFEASQMTRAMKGAEVKMALQGTGSGFLSSVMGIQYYLIYFIDSADI